MPMLKFSIIEGRNEEQLSALLDAAHSAMVEAFGVPETDRYQCVTQHRPGEIVVQDTGLGFKRSNAVVLLTVISRPRSQEQKSSFYRLLSERLQQACGVSPDDLIITVVENSDEDWSFGAGRAQFITGELS